MRRILLTIILIVTTAVSHASSDDAPFINRPAVQQFIQLMVKKHKFNKKQLETLFRETKVRKQIIQHLNKPLEKGEWNRYEMLFVSEWRIRHGVSFWNKYAKTLAKAEKIYGVPAEIIVATIGIESRYGERIGDYRVMDSLSNIAFSDSRRAAYFKSELEQFLLLTRAQHVNPMTIMGSYAGAIGQPQFMPSSYRHYAVNFSKSGKTDLMHNEVDVIGSIANYYKMNGWKTNQPVAIPARVIGNRYQYLLKKGKIAQPIEIADLNKYGIVPKQKPNSDIQKVKIIDLSSRYNHQYWLGYHNFDVIKRYNASDLYAMAVYLLGNKTKELRDRLEHGRH